MSEVQIENRRERDLRSCEVTFKKQLQIKPRKNYQAPTSISFHNGMYVLSSETYKYEYCHHLGKLCFFSDRETFQFIWLFSCFVLFCLLQLVYLFISLFIGLCCYCIVCLISFFLILFGWSMFAWGASKTERVYRMRAA